MKIIVNVSDVIRRQDDAGVSRDVAREDILQQLQNIVDERPYKNKVQVTLSRVYPTERYYYVDMNIIPAPERFNLTIIGRVVDYLHLQLWQLDLPNYIMGYFPRDF